MGSSLIILNGDFSKNAIYTFCKMLVKKGTLVTIPVRADANTILWTMEADARNLDEDTYFEFQVPEEYKNTRWYGGKVNGVNGGMFSPNQNPSANNIIELYIDVTQNDSGIHFTLYNSGLKKIVLFTKDGLEQTSSYMSAIQNLDNLEYFDASKMKSSQNYAKELYPVLCPKIKEVNVSRAINSSPITAVTCEYMLKNAKNCEILNLTNWRFTAQTTWNEAFINCVKLRKIYIDDADSAAILIGVLANVSSAKIDGEKTVYDSTNNVINVVHTD